MAFGGGGYRPKKFVATMHFSYSNGCYADSEGYVMTGQLYDYLLEHEEIPFYLQYKDQRSQTVVFRETGYVLSCGINSTSVTVVTPGQSMNVGDTHYGYHFGFVYNIDPYDA